MKIKATTVLITISFVSLMLILPVSSRRTRLPGNLNKFEVYSMDGDLTYYCKFNKMGWQQWHDEGSDNILDLYTKVLFADNFPLEVQAEMIIEGWKEGYLQAEDPRYEGCEKYWPAPVHILWLSHAGEE